MGGSEEFSIDVKGSETVVAVLPVQEHRLPLSNLDLLLPDMDVGVFLCYRKPEGKLFHSTFASMVMLLKASLAQALVTYYPFAGQVVANSVGEPELHCNNRGVDFVVVFADVELRELRLCNPDDSVEGKLVPKKKEGVLCVQATELKCGSLVLACSFDHRVADAYSANMFLVAWSEIAMLKPLSRLPSFRRSLLSSRLPLQLHPSFDRLFVPVSSLPPPKHHYSDQAVNRIYYIAAADINRMQSSAKRRTKIVVFTAYLWRVLAKAAAPEDRWCRMGVVVDGRSRLGNAAMSSYFGNVLSIPYGRLNVESLRRMDLAEVAEVVHGWLRPGTTEEHFRGLVDWVEVHRPEPAVARIYCGEADEGPGCVVSSGRAFPVAEVEFGWGKALFGSYHFPWGGSAGYVMPMPSAKGNGDWVVYMHLQKEVVEALEEEQPPVLRPLTPDYYLTDTN
ncbi:hypothetical protein C4D60_Mb03t13320 [Musa balbisiana]|uniref:Uncharacterized protein n=1 Tax=Musa balbisiana TaxID=52838 RepID=A0A4S8J9P1_MUSBA|nr:hypothetical protein C4D60_Mb03t13320 [Musa balbisiana]